MKLSNRIEQLEKELEELKELEKERLEQYQPATGDRYWFVNSRGRTSLAEWEYDVFDRDIYDTGNTYRTKEEAEFVAEKIRTEASLRKFSRPFEPWKDNFIIAFDNLDETLIIKSMVVTNLQGAIYFESEEKAEEAIRMLGEERIKKYIFGSVYND